MERIKYKNLEEKDYTKSMKFAANRGHQGMWLDGDIFNHLTCLLQLISTLSSNLPDKREELIRYLTEPSASGISVEIEYKSLAGLGCVFSVDMTTVGEILRETLYISGEMVIRFDRTKSFSPDLFSNPNLIVDSYIPGSVDSKLDELAGWGLSPEVSLLALPCISSQVRLAAQKFTITSSNELLKGEDDDKIILNSESQAIDFIDLFNECGFSNCSPVNYEEIGIGSEKGLMVVANSLVFGKLTTRKEFLLEGKGFYSLLKLIELLGTDSGPVGGERLVVIKYSRMLGLHPLLISHLLTSLETLGNVRLVLGNIELGNEMKLDLHNLG